MKTCLNRFLGRCEKCTRDYDPGHHPNNLDCPNYHEIEVLIVELKHGRDKAEDVHPDKGKR